MAHQQRVKPPREIRKEKKTKSYTWVKVKDEDDERNTKPKKQLRVTEVIRKGVATRCCTRCGYSDLECEC